MKTFYLIDGYNLLFAMGVLHGKVGPHGLEKARLRLLGLLHAVHAEQSANVTVVFDAAHAPPGAAPAQVVQGVQVRFSVGSKEADDLIEELIARAAAPKNLTVVSDDHRIQQAARRRHCTVLACEGYLDWLARRRRQRRQTPETPEKPFGATDTSYWLEEFRDVDREPGLQDLF
jgi:predicted RNA-binding protein with PIN domain